METQTVYKISEIPESTEHDNQFRDESPFMDIPETALYLRLPESTFRKLVAQRYRKIPLMKVGRKIIFKRDLIDSWAEGIMLNHIDL